MDVRFAGGGVLREKSLWAPMPLANQKRANEDGYFFKRCGYFKV
jgi:hypothetical protein